MKLVEKKKRKEKKRREEKRREEKRREEKRREEKRREEKRREEKRKQTVPSFFHAKLVKLNNIQIQYPKITLSALDKSFN